MAVNINLNDIQQEPIIVSANQTADLNKYYINTASATYTDPTPTEGKGFTVFVRNGTATVGGSAYAVAGTTIYRVYHSGVWANYTHNVIGTTSGTVCEGNDNRLSTSIHTTFSAALNPADATTYYSLIIGGLPQVSIASFGIRFLRTGTITDFNILAAHVGNGSGESTSIYLRNVTTATDYLITSSWLENYGASTFTNQSYTGLSIPIGNTTDLWNIKIVYPTFATNPTNVQYSWGILIN